MLDRFVGIVVVAALAAVAHGGFASAQQPSEQMRLEILTLPAGSVANGVANGIASVVSKKSSVALLPVPQAGPQVSVPAMERNEGAFTLINVDDADRAYRGLKPNYQQSYRSLRLASVGYENRVSALATVRSGVKTAADMKGKRVSGTFAAHQSCADLANAFMANTGLKWTEVTQVPVQSAVAGVQALGDGRVDVNSCAATGMGIVKEVNLRQPLRFIAVDPGEEAIRRARQNFAGLRPVLIKAGSTDGAPADAYVFTYDFFLASHAKISDEAVYAVVKAIWDNLGELEQINPVFKLWHQSRMANADVTLPYHPGAIKFFKEKGVWTDKMQKQTDALLR
jgi:TRAP transporter TAXI family solute receptor